MARAALSSDPLSATAPGLYFEAMKRSGAHAEAVALLEALVRRRPDASAAAALLEADGRAGSRGKTG